MDAFTYEAPAQRVVFGSGAMSLVGEESDRLGCRRLVVVFTPGQADRAETVRAALGARAVGMLPMATMHTPVTVTERALAVLEPLDADGLVSIGGGSSIGLSKALALRTGLSQIMVPTTYAGSEATPIVGQTEGGRKTTLRDPRVLARTIIYDPALTLSLPADTSITSGFNAIAHAIEALYAKDRNPVTSQLALQGIAALAGALPRIRIAPGDAEARSQALFGAWACGTCLGTVSMGLHHKICHVLGGMFDLPHAETHTVVLPQVTRFYESAAAPLLAPVATCLGAATAAEGLAALAERLGAPRYLSDLGLHRADIAAAAEAVAGAGIAGPRPAGRGDIETVLEAAF